MSCSQCKKEHGIKPNGKKDRMCPTIPYQFKGARVIPDDEITDWKRWAKLGVHYPSHARFSTHSVD